MVGNINEFVFSCYDPFNTEDTLASLIAQKTDLNHILAPMNTKLSTLGAAQVATKNDSVQLCYAQPSNYNWKEYSEPGSQYYTYSFHN